MKFVLIIFFLLYGVITCAMELTNISKEILSKIAACSEPCDRNNCVKVNKYLHDCFSIKNHAIVAHSPLKLGLNDKIFFMLYYCDEGRAEIVENLLNNGASASSYLMMLDISALSIVLQNEHYQVAELLQQYGANNEQSSTISPLCMAAYKGDLKSVKRYCENELYVDDNSLKVNGVPILCIAALGQTAIVEFLLTYFKSNPSKLIYKEDGRDNCGNLFLGRSALHFAAGNGNVSSLPLLLDSEIIDSDIDIKNSKGFTPLHYAVLNKQFMATQFLVERGANVNAQNYKNYTPLYSARDLVIAQYLLDNGALVNVKTSGNNTLLHYIMLCKEKIDLIGLYLKRGVDINALNNEQQTPLHYAAIFKNNAAIKLLIACGAQKNIRDNKGKLAVEYAAEHPELDDCIELLSCESDAQQTNTSSFFESTKKWFGFFT